MHLPRIAVVAVLCLSFGPSPDAFAQQAEDKEIIVAQSGLLRGFNPFSPLQKLFGSKERRRGQQPQKEVKKRRAPARAAGTPPKYENARQCVPIHSDSPCVQLASAWVVLDAPSVATKICAVRTSPVSGSTMSNVAPA